MNNDRDIFGFRTPCDIRGGRFHSFIHALFPPRFAMDFRISLPVRPSRRTALLVSCIFITLLTLTWVQNNIMLSYMIPSKAIKSLNKHGKNSITTATTSLRCSIGSIGSSSGDACTSTTHGKNLHTTNTRTNYRKKLYIILALVVLWCLYLYVQYQYYYSSATIAAVNRLIRHEALLLEQQQLQRRQQQQQQQLPPNTTDAKQLNGESSLLVHPSQLKAVPLSNMGHVSPKHLRQGSSPTFSIIPR